MPDQNLKNHTRYIPVYHFIIPLIVGGLLGWGIINFVSHHYVDHIIGAFMIIVSVVLLLMWWYARAFALRAQDRAIRAEENFRHFILTGKPLHNEIKMSQIIALRFASDEEFPGLAQKAVNEHLSSSQIKQAIKNWRADYHRA